MVPDTNPEPQEGENPDTIDINHNTEKQTWQCY